MAFVTRHAIRLQQQRQRGWKLYSFHAPEVECIGKGKASAPYEFGVKASIVTTNARAPGGQFVLHTKTLPGNPYDGHTLRAVIETPKSLWPRDRTRLCRQGIPRPRYDEPAPGLHLRPEAWRLRCHQARAHTPLRHRSRDRTHEGRRPSRPLLSQRPRGDAANAILTAVGHNLRLILTWLRFFCAQFCALWPAHSYSKRCSNQLLNGRPNSPGSRR